MNKVFLHGNLTSDPLARVVDINGKQVTVANFTVAVNRNFKTSTGEHKKQAEFISCEIWDSGATLLAQYLKKGSPIIVEGSLRTDKWEKDGQKHFRTFVRVDRFDFCGGSKDKSNIETEPEDTDKKSF